MQKADKPRQGIDYFGVFLVLASSSIIGWLLEARRWVAAGVATPILLGLLGMVSAPKWDWARAVRRDGDERQVRITDESCRVAFLVVFAICVFGSSLELGVQRTPGAFSLIAAIAAVAYLTSIAILVRRS